MSWGRVSLENVTTWDELVEPDDLLAGDLSRTPTTGENLGEIPLDEVVDSEGGLSDPWGAVHVWVDDDHRVSRVAVSTAWRDRAPQPLAACVLFAAQQATMSALFVTASDDSEARPNTPPFAPISLLERPFDRFDIEGMAEEALRLGEELDALKGRDDVVAAQVRFTPPVGVSANGKVAVTLDEQRRPRAVDIEDRWVASARTERINAALGEAFTAAYGQWRAPVIEPGERERIVARMKDLRRRARRPLLVVGGWIDPREEQR